MTELAPTLTLNDGRPIPALGFGTYPLRGEKGADAVASAIGTGYRLIDTAFNYENEGAVGEGIRRGGVPREELFVTSKLPGRYHAREQAGEAVRESLWRLGLDYLDLYIIHWPNPSVGKFVEAYEALVQAREEGVIRSVGVSNFTAGNLRTIIEATGVTPAVNQIELHPSFPQEELRAVHAELGVVTEAWSPLGKGAARYDDPAIVTAAERHGVSPAQVILRWHVQLGSVPIPKSATPARQAENLDVFGFELSADEVAAITALGRPDGRLFGGDPETHEEQ
ncbi:aldo/keto reductase [Herbiconiux flava]|uniref:Diketogulonate reductase-like aldo/keto reductase n=1 Tax=Herbiconiux flava TaxID=881268 RepID=A0A852STF5_9MICO|nr:aldo/keto reductase [Herbiconiux flava]NYD72137.1 diketogulonate reductase-like aldo/keto reductase [Herbiconiux flava]GLK17900.1 oxidoreductase [Herbiconiux flava]